MPAAIIALAAVAVAALAVVAVVCVLTLRSVAAMTQAYSESNRRVNTALLIRAGVEPHHADPKVMSPRGVAYDAIREAQADLEREQAEQAIAQAQAEKREIDDALE